MLTLVKSPPKVTLDAPGGHHYNMTHLIREGGQELLKQLLEKAGISGSWRASVLKQHNCSGMTPPVSVYGYRHWCVYVRIKPGDNNTCHNVALIVESSEHKAEALFKCIKKVEKEFDRNWRLKPKMTTTLAPEPKNELSVAFQSEPLVENRLEIFTPPRVEEEPPTTVVVPSVEEEEEGDTVFQFDENFADYLKDVENLKKVCCEVHNQSNKSFEDNRSFRETLCKTLGLNVSSRQAGAMLRTLWQRGYLSKKMEGKIHIGFFLTEKGLVFAGLKGEPVVVKEESIVSGGVDLADLIIRLGGFARELSEAAITVQTIRDEKAKLLAQVRELNCQEEKACAILKNAEVDLLLSKVLEILHR